MTTQPPSQHPPDPWGQQPQQPQHPHQPYQQHPTPPAPPPRPRRVSLATPLAILIGCGLFFGGCLFGVAIGGAGNQTTGTTQTPAAAATDTAAETTESTESSKPATTTKPAATKPAPPTIGEGTWEVGSEVKPGTYTTTVPADSNSCYWARLSGFTGDDIIANDISSPGQRARVTIRSSDKGFETQGCGTWTRTS